MGATRMLANNKSESWQQDDEGGVFVLCIDRAKMIRDLLEVINNPSLLSDRKN